MAVDFSEKGKVKFTMYGNILEMIEDIPEGKNTGEASTPVRDNLLRINGYGLDNL